MKLQTLEKENITFNCQLLRYFYILMVLIKLVLHLNVLCHRFRLKGLFTSHFSID